MKLKDLTPSNEDFDIIVGELTVTFAVAAKMEAANISPDSEIANGVRAILEALSKK